MSDSGETVRETNIDVCYYFLDHICGTVCKGFFQHFEFESLLNNTQIGACWMVCPNINNCNLKNLAVSTNACRWALIPKGTSSIICS